MNPNQPDILSIFNVVHLSDSLIQDYLENQNKLINEGIVIQISSSNNGLSTFNNFKNKIKNTVAMVDDLIYNELFEYNFHIHYNSTIYIEIRSFLDNKKIWGETKTFDDHVSFFKNFNDIEEVIKSHTDIFIYIKVIKVDKKHMIFNQMLSNKKITRDYLTPIFKESLRALKLTYYYKITDPHKESELDFIIKNNDSEFVKTNIELFKNSFNLIYLLNLCKHDFWKNSNF